MRLPVPLHDARNATITITQARAALLPYLSLSTILAIEDCIQRDFEAHGVCGNMRYKKVRAEVMERVAALDLPVSNAEMVMLISALRQFWDLALAARLKAIANLGAARRREKEALKNRDSGGRLEVGVDSLNWSK